MDPIKEALTFDDVTLAPKYSEILPSDVNTRIKLTEHLKLRIPLLSSAMGSHERTNIVVMASTVSTRLQWCASEWW